MSILLGWLPAKALAQCAATGTDQACTNPAGTTVSGGAFGIRDFSTLTATNFGTIKGTTDGIRTTNNANITNFGTISGTGTPGDGVSSRGDANVTNFGTITGIHDGIRARENANVTNSGTMSGTGVNSDGIFTRFGDANVTNSGTITGKANGISAISANVVNSGTIAGTGFSSIGINAADTINVTNSGSISGTFFGIGASTVNVTNSGIIFGKTGAIEGNVVTVNNSGTIAGVTPGSGGISAGLATIINSGTITGAVVGTQANSATVINSGTISGRTGIDAGPCCGFAWNLVNSGNIIGTGGTAINFKDSSWDQLTILSGSHIQGEITLGFGDAINFGGGNNNLTFTANKHSPFTVSGSIPFAVLGHQAASIDPTAFGLADKNLMNFTGAISGILGSLGRSAPAPNGAPLAFGAPGSSIVAQVDDAFASIPAFAYAANDAIMFKNPTIVAEDGRSVWARGFVGERVQQADATSLHATTDYAGGVVGADLLARPDLRLGVFVGAGESRLAVDLNLGSTDTNTVFGGGYGRYAFASFGAPSFLDFALHGGASTNATSRTINNNIAPSGTEIATANYHGAYVSPELKYGVDLPMWGSYTITPSARVRYVAGFFGGYTESGSTADLTVASRTTQDIEERGEVKLTQTTTFARDDQLLTSLYGGVVGLQRVGDTTINTVLLGASLPFVTPGQNDVVGELGGLGFEWRTRNGVSFFGAGEYTAMSDKSSNVAAKGGLRVAF